MNGLLGSARRRAAWRLAALALGAALAGAAGCGGAVVRPGEPFQLAPGESVTLGKDGVTLAFLGVAGDSRCPAEVTCVWEGDAAVELLLGAGPGMRLVLHTSGASGMPRAAEACGHRIALLDLQPVPRQAGVDILPAAYRATLEASGGLAPPGRPNDCVAQRLR